ncbi:ABC transporter substrate-binding protein [Luteimonas marina]|uniref:ABC transporter substrate-binding protein n=2 Tax=Luteimonas marina TaxID=488485 RepID=A0A5C5TVC1_9GAMM|nr:ABC transporter substrate-binding protein [Luteimonas marina]
MRQMTKWIVCAAMLAMLAGCASVQVSGPVTDDGASAQPVVNPHWNFDPARPAGDRDGYRPPRKLAVLLPMTGQLATAAASVRDGLLAGYYAERRGKPELAFYDTAGTVSGAISARDRAIAEGADQILGPLGRDEVSALFQSAQPVPLLALNRGSSAPSDNGADFSLAPEDEGTAAAAYALARNAKRVLVLSNGDDHAQRSINAFRARLEAEGGAIVGTLAIVGDKPADQSDALRSAATREGGVDAILIALRGSQARLVVPQLFAAGLGDRLRVATSQLTSGTGKADEDKALDGIAFASETWTSAGLSGLPSPATLAADLPTARGPAARLFAFGHDAWLLSGYLQHLAEHPEASLDGATGRLTLDAGGNVQRAPAWATFSNGIVVPLAGAGG